MVARNPNTANGANALFFSAAVHFLLHHSWANAVPFLKGGKDRELEAILED